MFSDILALAPQAALLQKLFFKENRASFLQDRVFYVILCGKCLITGTRSG